MTAEKLQQVQSFLSQIEDDGEAKAKFEQLAASGDVAAFEQWAKDSGCDPEFLGSLMPSQSAPDGELSDEALDGVAGGASIRVGWFAGSRPQVQSNRSQLAGSEAVSAKINSAWARWQKINFGGGGPR